MKKGIRQNREQQKRIPAGMPKQKLKVKGMEPGYKYYFASEDQIDELHNAGYTLVANKGEIEVGEDGHVIKGSIVSRSASRSDDSRLYLMRIKQNWYEENQKIKHDLIDKNEQQILHPEETETTYIPQGQNTRRTELLG